MNVGIFCKTCKADLAWLYFALSSFRQNWRHPWEMTDLVVVADPDCEPEITRWDFKNVRVVYTPPWPDGYCHAMAMKLCADIFCDRAELIVLFDSDMMLLRPTSLFDLLVCENPVIVYDIWHSDIDQTTRQMAKKVWVPAVRRSMGRDLDRDWMVSPKWLYWPSTFRGARSLIESHHRMPFLQAVYSAHPYDWQQFASHPMTLCDMQALGIFAHEYEQHKYVFWLRSAAPAETAIKQFWSHAPIDEAKPFIVSATPSAPTPQSGSADTGFVNATVQHSIQQWEPAMAHMGQYTVGTPNVSQSQDLRMRTGTQNCSGINRAQPLRLGQSG